MKTIAQFLFLLVSATLAASCGDGGGDTSEFSTILTSTLVASGDVPPAIPAALSQVTVVSSAAQLTQLSQGRFPIPASLANYNFANGDVVYVEAFGDQDAASVVRIVQVTRGPGGEVVNAETCATSLRVAGTHRGYAIYTTPKLPRFSAYSLVTSLAPDCAAVKRVTTTFVTDGAFLVSGTAVNVPRVIRTQADLDTLRAQVPGVVLPAQYQAPNFSQVNLLYLEVGTSSHIGPYARLMALFDELDDTHTAVVELCDAVNGTSHTPNVVYAVYAVAPIAGDVRLAVLTHGPGQPEGCVTAR